MAVSANGEMYRVYLNTLSMWLIEQTMWYHLKPYRFTQLFQPTNIAVMFRIWHTLHTIHYTLYTTHYTLHTTHYTLYTTHYTLYTTHYTLHTTHYTLHTIQYQYWWAGFRLASPSIRPLTARIPVLCMCSAFLTGIHWSIGENKGIKLLAKHLCEIWPKGMPWNKIKAPS